MEEIVDPSDWQRAGIERGTPFALAHRFFQSGPFRPGNINAHAPGLVFTGSGTVPGVGVPMVLLSGRLAADRVDAADMTAGTEAGSDYEVCRFLHRRHGTTYFWATHVLRRQRPHVHALYAYCREADEIVDDVNVVGEATVTARREALVQFREAHVRLTPRRTSGHSGAGRLHPHRGSPGHRTRRRGAIPPFDGDGSRRRWPLRHLGRPAHVHGRVGSSDRRDDAAGARAPRSPGGVAAGARSGPRLPAHQFPARRR